MSTWKAKSLSLAGRAALIRSVLNSLPIYYMQITLLPAKACDDLDKVARDFLWGSCGNRRRPSLGAWNKICTPSQFGGLGFKSTRRMNEALIMKLEWELMTRRDKLWVNVLRHKYSCGNDIVPKVMKRGMESNIWRGSEELGTMFLLISSGLLVMVKLPSFGVMFGWVKSLSYTLLIKISPKLSWMQG